MRKAGFHRRDHWYVDGATAAVDAEVEHAQRHDRVVAFLLGAPIGVDKGRRYELDLRRRHAVQLGRSFDSDDADFDL
jgi:hypothetical protein